MLYICLMVFGGILYVFLIFYTFYVCVLYYKHISKTVPDSVIKIMMSVYAFYCIFSN